MVNPTTPIAIASVLSVLAWFTTALSSEVEEVTVGVVGSETESSFVDDFSSLGEGAGDAAIEDRQRPLTSEECKVEVTLFPKKGGRGDEAEASLTLRNSGDSPVGEVLVVIDAKPMTYWGNSPQGLSVFPQGKVDLYFAGADGEPFLRVGQAKTIPIYHRDEGEFRIGTVRCSTEDIFQHLVDRVEVADRFGKYAPYAESSLRSLYLSEAGWKDILASSGARDSGEVGRRYFFSSVADSSLSAIAVGVGMMAAGSASAPEDQRGYMAETSFTEARAAFEEGNLDQAVDLLRRTLILEPENAMALNNLAYIMLKRGDSAGDVRPFIEQAIKIDPAQPGFQNTLSILRWREGDRDEAIRLAQQAYAGSGGEIIETRLNLAEWGGSVPETPRGEGGENEKAEGGEKKAGEERVSTVDSILTTPQTESR